MLIKTGQSVKLADALSSKIRFYVKEGLLQPSGLAAGDCCLFDEKGALNRIRQIAHLQTAERKTIGEIKDKIRATKHHHLGEEDHG